MRSHSQLTYTLILVMICISIHVEAQVPAPVLVAEADGSPGPGLRPFIDDEGRLDSANRILDVIYGRKDGMALTMDVYAPREHSKNAAIIYVMNGGYWSGPEYRRMSYSVNHIRNFVNDGFIVFVVLQGSLPRYSVMDMSRDIHRSIRFIRHNCKDYSIAPDRIGLFGHSSGGHLVLLVATTAMDGQQDSADPVKSESSKVNAVVAIAPPTDLVNYGSTGTLITTHLQKLGFANQGAFDFKQIDPKKGMFLSIGDNEVAETLRKLSPISNLSEDDPPSLLIHGDKDLNVPMQQSESFVTEARQKDVGADILIVPGKGHEPLEGTEIEMLKFMNRHLVRTE